MKFISVCLLLFVLFSSSAFASQGLDETLTLAECVESALLNSENFKIAHEKSVESGLKVRESWGGLWPDLSTGFSATRVSADKGMSSFNDGNMNFRLISGSLSINPGVFYETLKSARDERTSAVEGERKAKAETTVAAVGLYYRVMLASEIAKFRAASVSALEENLRVVTAAYRSGSSTNLDYLRAKVATANENTRLIAARNEQMNAVAELSLLTGGTFQSRMRINAPDYVNASEVEQFAVMDGIAKEERVLQITSIALRNRPELIQLECRNRAASESRKAAESVYLFPTLFAKGSYGSTKIIQKHTSSDTTGLDNSTIQTLAILDKEFSPPGWNADGEFTVGATWHWGALSPFDSRHSKANALESRESQGGLEMKRLVKEIQIEVQRGFLKLVSAASAISSQRENIHSAEEYFRVATLQYKSGTIDNQKLLEANAELQNAKTLYIQAYFDYQTAKAELNRYAGTDIFTFEGK